MSGHLIPATISKQSMPRTELGTPRQNTYNVQPCHSSYEPLMMNLKAVSKMAIMNCLLTQLTFKEDFIAYTQYKNLNNAMCNCKDQVNKNLRTQKMTQTISLQLHSNLNDFLYENLQHNFGVEQYLS
jgi:hypothetical protein